MVQPDFETWNEWANSPKPIDELYSEWIEENGLEDKVNVPETDETDETVRRARSSPESNERRDSVVRVDKLQTPEMDISKNMALRKAGENFYEVDDMLMEAFEKQIWQDDMTKAPNMWQRDDDVPQFVRSHVKNAIKNSNALYDSFDNIPHTAALKVHEIITDQLTDSSGWSIETVAKELSDEFPQITLDKAEDIARTEIASVLNKAREMAYDAAQAAAARNASRNITGLPDDDGQGEEKIGYYWAGPEDHATTKICSETKSEIESRGGYVSKDELKEILREKAKEHQKEDGGLPNRVSSFVPHYQCRHTFIREDYQRVT